MSTDEDFPDAAERASIAYRFFADAPQFRELSDRGWSSMTEQEREGVVEVWRQEKRLGREAHAVARRATIADRLFNSTCVLLKRNMDALVANLPRLLKADLERAVHNDVSAALHEIRLKTFGLHEDMQHLRTEFREQQSRHRNELFEYLNQIRDDLMRVQRQLKELGVQSEHRS